MKAAYLTMCGACGGHTFKIYIDKDNYPNVLKTESEDCKSVSVITVFQPNMNVNFGDRSDGVLCIDADEEDAI